MDKPKNRIEAEAQGYTVDTTTYPWCAYIGSRFYPAKWCPIMTDKEAQLLAFARLVAENADRYADDYTEVESLRSELRGFAESARNVIAASGEERAQ